ncbi:hypothetical protein NliqN6_3175 [Naganishia liquefaciens]|uniref:GH16 domain-containing protein n=1 Tax=Naganishia liquefaciens TaxID=104408 RepID=A0A8H3TTE3_9TREE|nr:hypothetical protein NliqN6_3175 [Naganishia liquefaciens]
MVRCSTLLLVSGLGLSSAMAQSYKIAKRYVGQSFADEFDYFTKDDPTNGYVNYVSLEEATSKGMVSYNGSKFTMGVEATSTATGRGRDSVRITSKAKFNDGIYILDLEHMPVGCGTWPAYWTTTEHHWPRGGEIDILEGANALPVINSTAWTATTNLKSPTLNTLPPNADTSSLHTNPKCVISSSTMTGTIKTNTCDAKLNNNAGCGILYSNASAPSIGLQLNQQNGGWYAMWRDVQGSGGIYIWFWGRNVAGVPDEIRDGSFTGDISAANWGVPAANFTIPDCKKDFNDHVITFNIALCGDYTTSTYSATGCPGTCASFVMNNPLAFADAYFELNSLRVFTATGQIASMAGPEGLGAGAIAGIVVGAVAALVVAGGVWWFLRRRRQAKTSPEALNLAARRRHDESGGSVISTASGSESDKADAPYPVGVLLPGETPTPRKSAPASKSRNAGSSKAQGRPVGSSASGSRRPSRAPPVPSAAPSPAFALTADEAKKAKFRPGWAV